MPIAAVLRSGGLVSSNAEGMRMVDQGAVRIDGERVSDRRTVLPQGFEGIVQVGKRKFARIRLT